MTATQSSGNSCSLPIKPLLGVTKPFAGECLMSLMARTAAMNVFSRIRSMVSVSGVDVLQPQFIPFTRRMSTQQVSRLLDTNPTLVEGMMHPAVDPSRPLDKVIWYGTSLPRRFISIDRRFSPASLAKSAFIRAIWQVRPITFCPESMELLLTDCPHCGTEVGWRLRRGFHVCETCGRSLRRGRTRKVEWCLRSDARAVAELVSPFPEVRSAALQKLPQVFQGWEPGDAFVGAVELGLAFSFPDREQHKFMSKSCAGGDFSKFDVGHLVAGYRAMLEWPNSLHKFLPIVVDERVGDLHKRLGPFGKYFLWSNTYERAIGNLIREEVSKTLTDNDLIPFGGNMIRAKWMKRSDRLTRNEGGKRFGIEPRIVGRLSKEGCAAIRVGAKKGRVFYDPDRLGPSVTIYKSGLSAHECARRIGIPAFCIPCLATAGLISAITDHDALLMADMPLYEEQSVAALTDLLHQLPVSAGTGQSLIVCMQRVFDPQSWADVIDAMLRAEIPIALTPGQELGLLAKMRVDATRMKAFVSTLPARPIPIDVTVVSVVAGALLGIPGDTVAELISLGLLRGKFEKRIGRILLTDLADFSKRYLFGGEGDALSGRRGFSARMRARGLKPVAVVGKTWIWSREQAEAMLESEGLIEATSDIRTDANRVWHKLQAINPDMSTPSP